MGTHTVAAGGKRALALLRGRCSSTPILSAGAGRGAGKWRRSSGRGGGVAVAEPVKVAQGAHLPGTFDFEGALARVKQRTGFSTGEKLDSRLREVGSCIHLRSAVSNEDDFRLLNALAEDVEKAGYHQAGDALGLHRSKKHLQIWGDALAGSPVFAALVTRVLDMFDLTLVDCWANLYRGGRDSKAYHHDNYQDRSPRPTVTIGVSLGQERELAFQNAVTKEEVRLLQRNGDIFAFDEPFNNLFKHAVPPAPRDQESGTRLSVIIWANEKASGDHVVRARKSVQREIIPLEVRWDKWPTFGYGELTREARLLNGKGTSQSIEAALQASSDGSDPHHAGVKDVIEIPSEEPDHHALEKLARDDPEVLQVSRALTLQGAQQVLCILRGRKLSENRGWKIPVGWYAIHSGAKGINAERAERVKQVWPDAPTEDSLPHGAIMGLFYVETHRKPEQCRPDYIWARGPVCHIISKAVEFPRPIKAGGDKGLWRLKPVHLEQIKKQLQGEVPIRTFDLAEVIDPKHR